MSSVTQLSRTRFPEHNADYLPALDRHFGQPKVDRRGERWPLCPFHADHHAGTFSYSERGYLCFSCGAKGGLQQLAVQVGITEGYRAPITPLRPRVQPVTPPPPDWKRDPDYWQRYIPLHGTALDYARGRGVSDESISHWRIGCGVLPASRCHHPRLILPVFEQGRLVGIRGRQLGCECPARDKWLQAAGGRTVLFGAETLGPGRTVIVTEAPLSAILAVQEAPELAAVAGTAGAACWRDEWTQIIASSRPESVLVWFDHDDAGRTSGVKVVNELLGAGLRARLYQWPAGTAEKSDLADVVVSCCGR